MAYRLVAVLLFLCGVAENALADAKSKLASEAIQIEFAIVIWARIGRLLWHRQICLGLMHGKGYNESSAVTSWL